MAQLDAFFKMLKDTGASDLHLSSGCQPMLRLNGRLERIKYKVLENEELKTLLYEIAPQRLLAVFEETGDLDFAYAAPGLGRLRCNYFRQERGVAAAFRAIPETVPTLSDLGLPDILGELAMRPKGLVLVTGPTGSGKSTTLAAMLRHALEARRDHIITVEDPIEFLHASAGCLINQREVGRDTRSFAAALRGALREDPDIILVGEMRDLETIELALEAAETGHLVLSTLHTVSAAKTIDRVIDVFPGDRQAQIRSALSESLTAVISQTLLRRADAPGRVMAMELLLANTAVRNLIRENKIFQINSVLETAKAQGMRTLDDSLLELLAAGRIEPADALRNAVNKTRFEGLTSAPAASA
ncbi:type IV pilus twitching motility protein PilT [Solidesulfovibrio carbinolicus]|uniref:Type IV pili twitching motility protein PilT n=1 Tax=Solidesulfovibrio carbinolicus TaxID=296842 RepID=A0A4P6HNN8_9BACT|nr:type IV pilus twitching motility protein PilT [Solidesulfovibrio carbinolicus]QAZ68851.1 type IV pili twitching motility protein PilT [Solidesulfovibrio carbinolicus]HML56219.1 type IV pilus twitching motility protein PilT [Solidesulfovibrio magneticus]